MKFSTVAAAALCTSAAAAVPTNGWKGSWTGNFARGSPFTFTSVYHIVATPEQVVNASNVRTGGLSGGIGYYDIGLNSFTNTICYNITLINVRGNYSSPAATATHVHESGPLLSGPPRIAFPNPVGNDTYKNAIGCIQGPFRTGLNGTNGRDNGDGFHVRQIEANPAGFNADVHTSLAVPGAVRGQFI